MKKKIYIYIKETQLRFKQGMGNEARARSTRVFESSSKSR